MKHCTILLVTLALIVIPLHGKKVVPPKTNWSPLCALYEPGEWMYYFLTCKDGPPKDPSA